MSLLEELREIASLQELTITIRSVQMDVWTVLRQQEKIMAAIDDLKAAVSAERTVTAGVVTLLTDLNQRLTQAVAAGDMTQVQQLVTDLQANTNVLAAAVAANTPTP